MYVNSVIDGIRKSPKATSGQPNKAKKKHQPWSFSFYPQIILMLRSKSSNGLSMSFVVLNIFGFACYSTFTLMQYLSGRAFVQINDVVFALHALVLTIVTLFVALYFGAQLNLKQFGPVYCLGGTIAIIVATFTDQLMVTLQLLKLGSSLCKYIPQVYLNFKRQSTVGWSIGNVLLDATGGILSITQLFIDATSISDISQNFIKLGLGLLSLLFDAIFIVQHYVLYRNNYVFLIKDEDE